MELEREDLKKALAAKHIHNFERANIREIIKEINSKLKVLEITYGINIALGRVKYDGISFRSKINGKILVTLDGLSTDRHKWNSHAGLFGLKSSDFGKEVSINGKIGRIVGINTRSKKYPILVKRNDDRMIRCSAILIGNSLRAGLA